MAPTTFHSAELQYLVSYRTPGIFHQGKGRDAQLVNRIPIQLPHFFTGHNIHASSPPVMRSFFNTRP
ncbi:hypothetical protein [Paenibacillus terrae]|uniref:hypothetical protein n=1 Tax=Paenibacillus terrae TaxID=159743 RepID=UPI00207B16E3|nr:hypothetical protein [Paenibacillus terrae]